MAKLGDSVHGEVGEAEGEGKRRGRKGWREQEGMEGVVIGGR